MSPCIVGRYTVAALHHSHLAPKPAKEISISSLCNLRVTRHSLQLELSFTSRLQLNKQLIWSCDPRQFTWGLRIFDFVVFDCSRILRRMPKPFSHELHLCFKDHLRDPTKIPGRDHAVLHLRRSLFGALVASRT